MILQKAKLMSKTSIILTEVAKLMPGKSFGELALTQKKCKGKRTATVKCLTKCVFAVLHKTDYDRILGKIVNRSI